MQQGVCYSAPSAIHLDIITENAVDFAAANGILMKLKGSPKSSKVSPNVI